MKNQEVLDLYTLIFDSVETTTATPVITIIDGIKCTRLQYWKKRNLELLQKEFKAIIEALNDFKPAEMKAFENTFQELKGTDREYAMPELEKQIKEFLALPAVVEVLAEESPLKFWKIKVDDLPTDLNNNYLSFIDWMIE